jgi:hypothetical protein
MLTGARIEARIPTQDLKWLPLSGCFLSRLSEVGREGQARVLGPRQAGLIAGLQGAA